MKIYKIKITKLLFIVGLLNCQFVNAQNAVIVDPQLGQVKFVDDLGFDINANSLEANKTVILKIPILNDNHGKDLPAGSCKIKIGLGSKFELDSNFNISTANLNSYFSWSISNTGGQAQITGSLINKLPANITNANILFKLKSSSLGNSTITANFLITNHNTPITLSDENGNNNASSLAYQVNEAIVNIPNGEAAGLTVYPNPITNADNKLTIEAKQGIFNGKYTLVLFDAMGKQIQSTTIQLVNVKRFIYNINAIASGKYVLQVNKEDAKPVVVKIEKLK